MNPYTIIREMGLDADLISQNDAVALMLKVCPKWIPISEKSVPPVDVPVWAFHPDWVDKQNSDDGIHECVMDAAGNWHLVRWSDKAKQWSSRSSNQNQNGRPHSKRVIEAYFIPSHFMYKPMPPNYGHTE